MRLNPLFPTEETLGINTDLYELTMAAAYFEAGCSQTWATFELFTRELPETRSFFMAAGLEQALHYVEKLRFTDEALDYVKGLPGFQSLSQDFFQYLKGLRFSGHLYALPEGTIVFPNQPILQVKAPVIEAQILETYLINCINFQTMVASKAARVGLAAKGRQVVDFGSRRAHSPQAGVLAARAAFIGGCVGTSNVLAGYEMGIPVYGTMAHSFVQFFDQEEEAFRRFHETFGEESILLLDTYDTLEGARKVTELALKIKAVRLDSGDLNALAVQVRELLDRKGFQKVRIVASGDLNEEKLRALSLKDSPIDSFGVGTDLVVSRDAPTCNLVYKLVEVIKGDKVEPRVKTSQGKATLPYRKSIFRRIRKGFFDGDLVSRWDESPPTGAVHSLLQSVIAHGQINIDLPELCQVREHAAEQLSRLPTAHKLLHSAETYPVEYSPLLLKTQEELAQRHGQEVGSFRYPQL